MFISLGISTSIAVTSKLGLGLGLGLGLVLVLVLVLYIFNEACAISFLVLFFFEAVFVFGIFLYHFLAFWLLAYALPMPVSFAIAFGILWAPEVAFVFSHEYAP